MIEEFCFEFKNVVRKSPGNPIFWHLVVLDKFFKVLNQPASMIY